MPRSRRRIRTALGALLGVLGASMFLALAAPPAGAVDPSIFPGDWGYQASPASGSTAANSAEYGPQIAHTTIYQGVVVCVSGPCGYGPGFTVTTNFTGAKIDNPVGTVVDFARPGLTVVGSCTVITPTQVVCVATSAGSLPTGEFLFSGTTVELTVTGGGLTGTGYSSTTWVPGAGNTAPANDPANDVQTVTWDLAYVGEDLGFAANGTVAPSTSGTGAFALSCLAAPTLGSCYYPRLTPLAYLTYSAGAQVTSPIGSVFDLIGAGGEVVGACTVQTAQRITCSTDTGRALAPGEQLTSTGWTESFPAGADGTIVRTDTVIPYDGYCRDPAGCDGGEEDFNSEAPPKLGDVIANNIRTVALLAVVAPTPTPSPTVTVPTATPTPSPTTPALAATGAHSANLLGVGLICLALGALALGILRLTGSRARH